MFNLLVKYSGWGSSRDTIGADRVFEYTDDANVERFKPRGELDSEKIIGLPALFLSESGGDGEQVARVGQISRVRRNGKNVALEYSYDAEIPPIPNATIEGLADELGIGEFEFSRTHWAIKDADLFRALLRARLQPTVEPKLFKLRSPGMAMDDLISVMMPFDGDFDEVYEDLKRMAKSLRMKCLRADDIWDHDVVMQDVVSLIDRSKLVICDCSHRNPNVFYEIGIAHTLGKEVLLIAQSKDDVPFDIQHIRYVKYLNNAEGRVKLVATLSKRIDSLGI